MRQEDQKNSLIDYVKFILAAPVMPGLEREVSAIRNAQTRLERCPDGGKDEPFLAMDLVELLHRLHDKKFSRGLS